MQFCKVSLFKEKIIENNYKIKKPLDIVDFINKQEYYSKKIEENIIVIALDNKNNIMYSEIAKGGNDICVFNMMNIFRILLATNSNKFIIVHNHPSGDSKPSKIDFDMTERIKKASEIMGVNFLDHIIIGEKDYTSIFSEIKGGKVNGK